MGGKIVGFYGRSGENLEAIGAYFEPISNLYPVKSIGPFGGLVGNPWDDGKFDGVRGIEVLHNPDIRYIRFVYDDGGKQVWSDMHGCNIEGDYTKEEKVMLDYPQEYLTSISGYTREDGAIQSLTFYSNKRRHGPYGEEKEETGKKEKYFWYPSTGSRIIGFYGTCGETLNSIGVYAEPILHLCPLETVGPFGGSGGTSWDDGVHTDVRGFRISFDDVIRSIGIVYDNNGSPVECSQHGGGDGPRCMEFTLDYPTEGLVSILGWMNGNGNTPDMVIHNLKIVTTKRRHGPFIPKSWGKQDRGTLDHALEKLTRFQIPLQPDGGRIIGFFGRAGTRLNAIGARLEPILD